MFSVALVVSFFPSRFQFRTGDGTSPRPLVGLMGRVPFRWPIEFTGVFSAGLAGGNGSLVDAVSSLLFVCPSPWPSFALAIPLYGHGTMVAVHSIRRILLWARRRTAVLSSALWAGEHGVW